MQVRIKIDFIILLLVFVVGFFVIKNVHTVGDYFWSFTHKPSTEMINIANGAGMNDTGKRLFLRLSPSLADQDSIKQLCGDKKLGCTVGRNIYILKNTNETEFNTTIVTAAHEMLHVAYSRLSSTEKDRLASLIDAELQRTDANKIKDKLSGYPAEDYYNEAHSYIGSELSNISPDLEQYYAKYFYNRSKSTQAYNNSP